MRTISFAIFVTLVMMISSCKEDNPLPPKEQPQVSLSLEDVSCTEAWIKLNVTNLTFPADVELYRDSSLAETINLTSADTVLYVDSLLPNKEYSFKAEITTIPDPVISDQLPVTTLVTSSGNFNWQKYQFGNYATNIFYDCAIISEDDIWCVGVFSILDTVQNIDTTYNAVHWNGSEWELKRILYGGSIWTIKTIFAFNKNDVWFSAFVRFDGENFNELPIPNILKGWSINKIWGTSGNDLYAAGNNGNIAHYKNGNWNRVETGIDLNIHDINGFINTSTGKWEILCVADDQYFQQAVQIIRINENDVVELLDNSGLGIAISSVWFVPDIKYYIVGNGLYQKTLYGSTEWTDLNKNRIITQNYMESIRGNGLNDIIVVGAFGEVLHFNGLNWTSIKNGITSLSYGSYYKNVVKQNLVIAVGYDQYQAIALIGRR